MMYQCLLLCSLENNPNLTEVEYFTDKCAAQHKNDKSVCTLCQHSKQILSSYNFFARSHTNHNVMSLVVM